MPKLRKGINIKWKLTLPSHLAGRVEMILMDKMSGRPIYGARSELIRQLLERWIADGAKVSDLPLDSTLNEGTTANG